LENFVGGPRRSAQNVRNTSPARKPSKTVGDSDNDQPIDSLRHANREEDGLPSSPSMKAIVDESDLTFGEVAMDDSNAFEDNN